MAAHHVYEETKSTTAPIMYRAHPDRDSHPRMPSNPSMRPPTPQRPGQD